MDATIQNGIALNPKSILTKVDTTPTADSNNPVSSDGVKTYVDQKDQATNIRVDTLNTQIAASFFFKGSSTFVDLPTSGNTINDTYYVTDSDKECWYSWNGTAWIKSSMGQADYAGLIAQLKADISAEYSTSKTYKVGDYCLYGTDGVLYICKTAVTTAGEFDSSKWQAISFGEAIGDLVIADDTQPTSLSNKIWLDTDPNPDTVEVITEEDLGNIVAAEFDASSAYEVGDYCIHDAKLYIANTATAANDGWITARWQQVSIMNTLNDEVDNLNELIKDINHDVNNISMWEQGGIVSDAGYDTSPDYATRYKRVRTNVAIPENVYIIHNPDPQNICYVIFVYEGDDNSVFDSTTYLGTYTGSAVVKGASHVVWHTDNIEITNVKAAAMNNPSRTSDTFYFRIVAAKYPISNNESIIPETAVKLQLLTLQTNVDKTLTIEGAAADAKTVGDRIRDLEAAVEELSPEKNINSIDLWRQGGIVSNTGSDASASSSTYTKRIHTMNEIPDNVIRIVNTAPDGFGYAVGVYTDRSWIAANWLGFYDNSGTINASSPEWITGDTDISDVKAAAQIKSPETTEFYYRLVGGNSESKYGVNTTPGDSVNLKLMANVEEKIEIDDTLTVEGMAADAKVTGDRIAELKAVVDEMHPIRDVNSANLWELGAIRATSSQPEIDPIGVNINSTTRIRTKSYLDSSILKVSVDSSHKYIIFAYTDTSDQYDESLGTAVFKGVWNGSTFGASSSSNWRTEDTDVADLNDAAGAETYRYRLVLAENSDAAITQAGYSGAQLMSRGNAVEVDSTLTVEGMAADAKATGDRISDLADKVQNNTIFVKNEGFPLIITDVAEGKRFESVQIPFGTMQIGSGDPSPSNIQALVPPTRTPAFYRCGANLYTGEGDTPNTAYNSEGVIGPSIARSKLTDHIPVSGESEIVLLVWNGSSSVTYSMIRVGMYDADGNLLNGGTGFYNKSTSTGIFTDRIPLSDGTATVRVSFFGQWNLGVYAASAAESLTVTLPDGSVGGGVWDPVNGTLTVDRLYKSLDGTEKWVLPAGGIVGTNKAYFSLVIGEHGSVVNESGICSHFAPVNITSGTTDVGQKIVNSSAAPASARLLIRPEDAANATVDTFKAWLAAQAAAKTPVQVCWRLAEPVVYTVDAVTIAALSGVNTLFSNTWEHGADYDVVAEIQRDTSTIFKTITDALEVLSPGIIGDAAITDWNEEGYISLALETVNLARIVKPSGESHARHILLSAQEGDTFTITATGGLAARAYGFIAEDNTILAKASAPAAGTNNVILVNEIITAPAGTKWLIVNDCSYPFTGRVFRGVSNATRNNTLPSMNQMSGIPVLELTGDTSRMTKGNKVTLNYSIFDRVGTCTVKWQGSSSVRYGKKNYTVTFDYKMDAYENWQNFKRNYGIVNGVTSGDYPVSYRDFCESNSYAKNSVVHYNGYFYRFTQDYPAKSELGWDDDIVQYAFPAVKTTDGTAYVPGTAEASKCSFKTWGRQKKYCFKANYIDASHARNIVNARLWGRMVAARIAMGEIADARADSPNYGAIDGFPCEIKINGISRGLYTFNIPKDAWTFDMDKENDKHFVVGGEDNSNSATKWMTATVVTDPTAPGYGTDYGVEVGEDYAEDALISINNAIAQANSPEAASDWETALADYVDIQSVYDYFIFTCCIANNDALARNILYGTYDGTKWFMSAYDLDTTYGFNPYGTKIFRTEGERTNFAGAATMHRLAQRMVTQSPKKLKERYDLWRNGGTVNGVTVPAILSDESVWNEFAQFLIDIPSRDYRIDRDLWPMIPGTEVMTVSNYMEYYRAHCKALDEEIEALANG